MSLTSISLSSILVNYASKGSDESHIYDRDSYRFHCCIPYYLCFRCDVILSMPSFGFAKVNPLLKVYSSVKLCEGLLASFEVHMTVGQQAHIYHLKVTLYAQCALVHHSFIIHSFTKLIYPAPYLQPGVI